MPRDYRSWVNQTAFPGFTPAASDRPNWQALADSSGAAHNIDPMLLMRLIAQESSFTPGAENDKGAGHLGPGQFDPGTARHYGMPAREDRMNPHLAVPGSASLLSDLQGRFGGMAPALAAYNGSVHPADPTQWKPETQQYVQNLLPGQLPVVDAEALGLKGMLANTMRSWESGAAGMLGQAQSALKDAQAQQADLFGQMQQNVDQPAPENNPQAEFMTRLMGNISQVLAPGLNGQKQAEQTIQKPLDDIQQKRAQNLRLLATKHEEAARQADKLGDREAALKHYTSVEKYHQQATLLTSQLNSQEDNASKERIAAAKELRGGKSGSRAGGKGGSRGDKLRAHADSLEADLMKGNIKDKKEAQRLITRYRAEADAYDTVDMPDAKPVSGAVKQFIDSVRQAVGDNATAAELLVDIDNPVVKAKMAAKGITREEAMQAIRENFSAGSRQQTSTPKTNRRQSAAPTTNFQRIAQGLADMSESMPPISGGFPGWEAGYTPPVEAPAGPPPGHWAGPQRAPLDPAQVLQDARTRAIYPQPAPRPPMGDGRTYIPPSAAPFNAHMQDGGEALRQLLELLSGRGQ